ncbi:proteasome component pup2 [Neodidymelliopsis sp. IMI 364377]|nr:proteasome component pup2 [Neodidymelliopsis sp. IMI 364377]
MQYFTQYNKHTKKVMSSLSVERIDLKPPPLEDLVECITAQLAQNFKSTAVSVKECPDLRQAPYRLAFAGLCGSPRVADVGGQPNLAPTPDFSKKYNLTSIAELMDMKEQGALLGAAAGPFHVVGMNSELMPNLSWNGGTLSNETHYAKVRDDGSPLCEKLPSHDCALMANLFGSAGLPGPVLHIAASSRTGALNFVEAIRKALQDTYGTRTISLGGVFLISKGKAKLHVMPDFSPTPLITDEQKEGWLRFYEMEAPLFIARSEYDRGINTFSPEGRLFQVEYSLEAIKLGSTAIGVATGEGVILGVEKRVTSTLLETSSVEKIVEIDRHIGCAMSGLQADARSMIEHARVESQNHAFNYNEPLRVESCTQAICDLALRFGEGAEGEESIMSRPFGVALLIAGYDEDGPSLYHAEPSGTFYRYDAKAIGSGSEGAQAELQNEFHKSLTLPEAEVLTLKTLKQVMEEKLDSKNVQLASVTKDKGFRIYTDQEMEEVVGRLPTN